MKQILKENSLVKWLRRVSVENKFSIIIGLVIFILVFETGNFWLSMKIASGLRAYVGGESLWSKAQKAADTSLVKYTTTGDEKDYQDFLQLLSVPLGDRQARLGLETQHPDYSIVDAGFIQGGNSISDLQDMRFLFRRFRHVSYMDRAITIWSQGDDLIQQLISTGQAIHANISSPVTFKNKDKINELGTLIANVSTIDQKLTVLENNFSSTLGEGSRKIRDLLLWLTIVLNILLGILAVFISSTIRKIIVEVDRAKSEFVSVASHQLRTPLTVIKWHSSSLLEASTTNRLSREQETKYLHKIYNASRNMLELVGAILNVSKIDLGSLGVEPEMVSIEAIARDVINEMETETTIKKMEVKTEFGGNLPKVLVDPKLIRILFQNLLTNAVKYTPVGGKITFSIEQISQDLQIKVSDTGIGISSQDGEKVFEKFFRTHGAKTLDPNGTGLGMYIAKAIVDIAQGKIWYESNPGQGTTFYVIIPLTGMKQHEGKQDLTETYS